MAKILVVLGTLVLLVILSVMGCTRGIPTAIPISTQVPQSTATATLVSTPTAIRGSDLVISMDAGATVSHIYTPGLKGVEMARIKFSAIGEEWLVRDLVLNFTNGNGNITRVTLLGTGEPSDFISLVGGNASFHFPPGKEIRIPAYSSRIITVDVDVTDVGTTIAGQLVTLWVQRIFAIGATSGTTFSQEVSEGVPTALTGNAMRVEEMEPVIIRHPSSPSGPQVPSTDQAVAVFQVTASGFRDLVFNGLMLDRMGSSASDLNVTRFSLWNGSVRLAEVTSESQTIPFVFPEQVITAGQIATLTVRADTTTVRNGAAPGAKVTFGVRIPGIPGPLGDGGFSWDYTPLNTLGTAVYTTRTDSYPVEGGVLEY